MPLNLGEVPDYYRRFLDPVDIVILKTCPMDENGYFNFSAANLWHRAVIERARMVVVEVSHSLPYVYGDDNEKLLHATCLHCRKRHPVYSRSSVIGLG